MSIPPAKVSLKTIKVKVRPEWNNYATNKANKFMCSSCVEKKCFRCEHRLSDRSKIRYIITSNKPKVVENNDDKKSSEDISSNTSEVNRPKKSYDEFIRSGGKVCQINLTNSPQYFDNREEANIFTMIGEVEKVRRRNLKTSHTRIDDDIKKTRVNKKVEFKKENKKEDQKTGDKEGCIIL